MKKIMACTILAFLASCVLAWAHGNSVHVMGTVTHTEDDHVVVTTPKGETQSIAIKSNTKFQQNGIHTDTARPQIGDRLVAEVTKKGLPDQYDWVATEIIFARPKQP